MNKGDLKNLTKTQLINLILKQNAKPIPKPRTTKPIPLPRKSVKQMVQDYEENIILPPLEFRDDYKPVPITQNNKTSPIAKDQDRSKLPKL